MTARTVARAGDTTPQTISIETAGPRSGTAKRGQK
jgi:hypothetical protein